jgi:phage/plasmid-like protein (TIGR03299 family)
MSAESLTWLNTMTLQGYKETRGTAWHYDAGSQGEEDNHYPGAIPPADIKRRLFYWVATEGAVKARVKAGGKWKTTTVTGKKALSHPETGEVFSIVGSGFQVHNYWQWLVENFKTILDADGKDLGIGSAGLLKGGAQAWVQIELPESIEGPGGIVHRPFLTGSAVLDGSRSTSYSTGSVLAVCDNTLSSALASACDMIKYPHRSGTEFKAQDVRDVLKILFEQADEVNAELDQLLNVPVSDAKWEQFVTAHIGKDRPAEAGRGQVNWDTTHDGLTELWKNDPMVAPWTGTAFGALQAVSTWRHHHQVAKNVAGGRPERNMISRLDGTSDREDAKALQKLQLVLAS